jgi:ribose transport system substrate-binding protein
MYLRKWYLWVFLITVLVGVATIGFGGYFSREYQSRPICFVVKDLGQEYWEVVQKGANSAAKEFQVPLLFYWVGNDSDVRGQIAFLDRAFQKKVRAVVLASCDMNAIVPRIAKLTRAGIPVITIDSSVHSNLPVSLIATDNVDAGAKAAQKLAELMHDNGEVAIINHVPGAAAAIEREQGFRDKMANYKGIKIVTTRYSYGDPDRAETVTEDTLDLYPKLAGVFAVNEPAAVGAAQALITMKRDKIVKLVGFDSSIKEIAFLEIGVIDATVVQNPFTMGYLGVRTALEVTHHKFVPARIDTGSTVITRENMFTEENQKLLFPFELIESK